MIEFKQASLEDLKNIQMVAYATWPVTFCKILPKKQIEYMLQLIYSEESLKIQITEKGHIFILLEIEMQAMGFTSYELNYNSAPQLMIHKLYLLPKIQGVGNGKRLIDLLSVIAIKNNNKQLRLKVYYKNVRAIGFYEKAGFKNVGTEITDIGNSYCILDNVMIKEL